MEHINFDHIIAQTAREYKVRAIMSEINRVGIENVMISDCLANVDREGLMVMRTLHDHFLQNRDLFYRIKVLSDRWGNPVKPGDKIEWKAGRKVRDPFGKKFTQHQIKQFEQRGELRLIEIWHNATVDSKGCIKVKFDDAALLLDTRGVHYLSGRPLTSMPEKDPIDDRDKVTRVQFYWLYEEINPEAYASLPEIKTEKK